MPKTRFMLSVLMLAIVGTTTNGADEPVKLKEPDKDIIKAWKDAGAYYRHVGIDKGSPFFFTSIFPLEKLDNPLPSFSIDRLKKGATVTTLPDPKVPFGIFLQRGDAEEMFKGIGEYENLRALCLPLNGIQDKGMEQISGLKNLEYLDIHTSRLTEKGMKELAKLKKLKFLNLSCSFITDKEFIEIAPLENLETLVLHSSLGRDLNLTGAGLQVLPKLKKLRHLLIWNMELNDADIAAIKGMDLESLELSGTKITGGGIKNLLDMKNLKRLNLYGSPLTEEDMKKIVTAMPKLEHLSISHTNINDECIEEISKLKGLNYLSLGDCSVTENGLKPLVNTGRIETLYIHPRTPAPLLKKLGELKSLKVLYLQQKDVSDKDMKEVAKLPKLETLRISSTNVTDKGLKELERIKTLKELDLDKTPTTMDGVNALRKALPACKVTKPGVKLD